MDPPHSPARPPFTVHLASPAGRAISVSDTNIIQALPKPNVHETGPPTKGTPRPKPAIEIGYLLILSRRPIYESRSWQPAGSFQELSLAQLVGQMPFGNDIKGLHFTFEGPGLRIKEWIECGNETGFARLKMHLNKGIRATLSNNHTSTKMLVYELEIEPQRDGAAVEDDGEDDLTSFF
jgi:hypothetical protein